MANNFNNFNFNKLLNDDPVCKQLWIIVVRDGQNQPPIFLKMPLVRDLLRIDWKFL